MIRGSTSPGLVQTGMALLVMGQHGGPTSAKLECDCHLWDDVRVPPAKLGWHRHLRVTHGGASSHQCQTGPHAWIHPTNTYVKGGWAPWLGSMEKITWTRQTHRNFLDDPSRFGGGNARFPHGKAWIVHHWDVPEHLEMFSTASPVVTTHRLPTKLRGMLTALSRWVFSIG